MKKGIYSVLAVALALTTTLPAFAQKDKVKDKEKDKEVQHIIITRSGDVTEKTVIEIIGDKILVNGKEAKDSKDVSVQLNKVKDGHAYAFGQGRHGATTWNLDTSPDGFSLFNEDANRAMLGVVTDADDKGARIVEISEGHAADKAGLKKGDIITHINDKKMEDAEDVSAAVRTQKPGDKVNVTFLRDGKEQKVAAELGKWKGVNINKFTPGKVLDELRIADAPVINGRGFYMGDRPRLGLSVQDTEEGKGVKIIEIDEESNAAKAGLKEDDLITHINDKEVNTTDEVTRIVKEAKDKASIQVKLLRAGKTQTVEVRMPRKIKTADL